jgi:hypothetical protein
MMLFLLGCFVGALVVLLYQGASRTARPVTKAPPWPDAWLTGGSLLRRRNGVAVGLARKQS